MFKTHLLENKENLLGFSIFFSFILLAIVNIVVLVPQLLKVFSPRSQIETASLIDVETVNKAIEYLQVNN